MFVEKIIKKNDKKSIVYFDNGSYIPLYNSEIHKFKLAIDNEIEDITYDELYIKIALKRAKLRSMNILKSFDKTEKQLRDKLRDDGYDNHIIDEVISYLKSYKYIDDYRIAKNYYDYHCDNDSHNAIKQKLLQKGIDKNIIDEILSSEVNNEQESIMKLVIKKQMHLKCTDDLSTHKCIMSLMRKGYSYELSKKALEEAIKNNC